MTRVAKLCAAVVAIFVAGGGAANEILPKCLPAAPYPIDVNVSGSYRLCRNFVVPDANTTAIVISASNVTLDLDGYSIVGPVQCGWGSCDSTGWGGDGISADWTAENVTVTNGTVRGMGGSGVELGRHSRVERVKAIGNAGRGILVGQGSIVASCIANENGMDGINASEYCTIADSVAHANGGDGINGGCVSRVTGNSSTSNRGAGITTGGTSACGGNLTCENDAGQLGGCTQIAPNTCCFDLCP